MNTRRTITTAAAVLALVVSTGCGVADGKTEKDGSPDDGIRLSVPPEVEEGSADLVLEQSGLESGSEVSLFAYRTSWNNDNPTCQGSAEPAATVQVSQPSRETVSASLDQGPGRYWWVVVAPGYTSECGAPGSETRMLASPDVGLAQENSEQALNSEYAPPGKVDRPYKFNVEVSEPPPGDDPWEVDVVWYGPFESTPDAVAAQCTESTPIAAKTTVNAPDADDHEGHVTPKDPGVYRVVATIDRTSMSTEASTGCDQYSPFVVVE